MNEQQSDVLLVERPAKWVALLRLNRPKVLNALNQELRRAIAAQCETLASDDTVRTLVITGGREAFAAGGDIREMAGLGPVEMMTRIVQVHAHALGAFPKPVIAAVNGYAMGGGCELAMHADIVIAGEGARFGLPESRIGILAGAGGTTRLSRAVGRYKAMKMLLLGDSIGAAEAEAMGLVTEVVPDDEVLNRALALAEEIGKMPPLAMRQIKEVVLAGQDASLNTALLLERKALQLLFATVDQKEGMNAFLEKRSPFFEGR